MRETVLCGDCDGYRDDEGLPCPTCGGTGEVDVEMEAADEAD